MSQNNFQTRGGAPGSAGDDSTRVDRPNESLPGVATTISGETDTNPATFTRALMDSGKATYQHAGVQRAYIDTTETSRSDRSVDIKRANSSVW